MKAQLKEGRNVSASLSKCHCHPQRVLMTVIATSLIVEENYASSPSDHQSVSRNSYDFCEQLSMESLSQGSMKDSLSVENKYYSDANCYNNMSYDVQSLTNSSIRTTTEEGGDSYLRSRNPDDDVLSCSTTGLTDQGENVGVDTRNVVHQQHVNDESSTQSIETKQWGIAEYIVDDVEDMAIKTADSMGRMDSGKRHHLQRRKQPQPWYCVSRPISEQTRDIKIRSVNKSTSIYYSKLLEKCRSIVEFCMPADSEKEELNESNMKVMNYNYNWGDSLPKDVKGNTIRVVYQNVHRSLSASDNPHTSALLDNLNMMEADIFMASETNINWKSAEYRNRFKSKVARIWPAHRMAYSSSDVGLEFELHEFLPGGTCTMAVDNLSMRVVKAGEDESGLGRWSYITLEGQGGRKITFITAYRICNGAMRGTSTSCMQQKKVLNNQEMRRGLKTSSPDTAFLRQKFIEDLAIFIQALKEAGHAIVLGLDANETTDESMRNGECKKGSISWLFEQTELFEVFESHHNETPDSTTTTPARFIDRVAVYGIPLQRVTLLRANMPAKSDHLGIAIDLDLKYLFNNACSPLVQPKPRKLTSGNKASVQKYIAFIQRQFNEHKIVERCQRLREACDNDEFTDSHRKLLYALDRQVTEILLGAENQCSKKTIQRNLWSPALKKAGMEIGYWKQRISTNGQIDEGTRDLGSTLGLPATIQQPMQLDLCKFYLNIAWKSYRGVQAQERMYREKFLKERAQEQANRGNGDVATALKQIRHREKLKRDYVSIKNGYGVTKHGLATLDTPDETTGGRKLITNAEEIHAYLLKRNERHFSQATFTTFGDAGPGFPFIDPDNPDSDKHIDDMLDGVFEPWESASPYVREFLRELKCTVTKEVDVTLHLADFKQLFKTIPEKTASSVSGLHYGHYRVLSQMEDETIISVLFHILNIAFKTHSPLPRWKHATQLMLEKGKGPGIENLRIIQILEADMNWLLRYLWGRKLERHAVEAGVYNEAQFASPGKLCHSAIVNKVIFFDLLRQTKQYGALMDNDATAAFDRVLPALCVVTCRQLGMPKSAQRFFFKILRQMVYTTTTAHGTSKATYSASANPKIPGQGVIQGGGASLPNYKSQQLPVVNGYESNCVPAVFRQVSRLRASLRRWVSGFSDDMSLLLNELGVRLSGADVGLPIAQRVRNALQRNAERYEAYFFSAGGSLNVKKCFYYLVGFVWTGTDWRYKSNEEMQISNVTITPTTLANDGVPQEVHWCEADEAQRTLGSHIAPDGSSSKQMEVLFGKLRDWQQCLRNMTSSNLQARWLSYKTVFLKKLLYPLIGHSLSSDDLQDLQKPIDREILHILGTNEHFSRALLRAPLLLGGMGCTSIHGQHVIDKLVLFVHHMREAGQIKDAMLTSMGITQIKCGSARPWFDLPAADWNHLVTKTWITHIWNECQPRGINIKFHTESFWVPKPVRERDICIMDVASSMYKGQQLRQINMCRLALQVTYLSDIAAVDGKRILLAYFHGKNHKESGRRTRLQWPPVGELPRKWWSLWQEFLMRWCGTSLVIPNPLGWWYHDAEMLTQCCFFLHGRRLLMQHDEELYEFSPSSARARTRFSPQAHLCRDTHLLLQSKVVDVTYRSQAIYVISQSDQNVIAVDPAPAASSLQDLYRNLDPELQRLIGKVQWPEYHDTIEIVRALHQGKVMGVSDGSVRTSENRASQAWVIQAENGSEISGYGPVDGALDDKTSHRAELQGQTAIFLVISLLLRYFQIMGSKVVTYCDNQAVVKKLQSGWKTWRYRNTKGADSDLQSLLYQTISSMKEQDFHYSMDWVQGHQDEDKKSKKVSKSAGGTSGEQRQEQEGQQRGLTRQANLNIRMDHATKAAYHLPPEWQSQPFLPVLRAEGCAVYISERKLTSNLHLSLAEQWHEQEAKDYLRQRHNISPELFPTIHWKAIRYALKKLSPHRRATAVKAIHRHLPTQAKLHKQGRVAMSSLCPRCLQMDETNEHIYCCANERALKQRKEDWCELWKQLHKCRTATVIEQVWRYYLQPILGIPLGESIVDGLVIARGDLEALLELAVQEQSQIGWEKLLLGMGSTVWKSIQEHIDMNNPTPPKRTAMAWMNTASHQLLKFSLRCWKERNRQIHGETIQEQKAMAMQHAREQITEIYRNPPALDPQFRSIFEIPLAHRLKMPLQAAEQWISMVLHQAKVTQHNLKVLLTRHTSIQSHFRTMRRIARQQAKERNESATPRKAHRREVQAAVRNMREKLYASRASTKSIPRRQTTRQRRLSVGGSGCNRVSRLAPHTPLRQHPP